MKNKVITAVGTQWRSEREDYMQPLLLTALLNQHPFAAITATADSGRSPHCPFLIAN